MTSRAPALPMQERREALIAATIPLLRVYGAATTTRHIAAAAQVAEGTIFRVFGSKDELIRAATCAAFAPNQMLDELARISLDLPLQERLVELVTRVQAGFVDLFDLMHAMGLVRPPDNAGHDNWTARYEVMIACLIEPDAAQLSVSPQRLAHLLRLLTFAGSHAEIADHQLLRPADIVDALLNGTRKQA